MVKIMLDNLKLTPTQTNTHEWNEFRHMAEGIWLKKKKKKEVLQIYPKVITKGRYSHANTCRIEDKIGGQKRTISGPSPVI